MDKNKNYRRIRKIDSNHENIQFVKESYNLEGKNLEIFKSIKTGEFKIKYLKNFSLIINFFQYQSIE